MGELHVSFSTFYHLLDYNHMTWIDRCPRSPRTMPTHSGVHP